jgi:hypothetical protein
VAAGDYAPNGYWGSKKKHINESRDEFIVLREKEIGRFI